MTLRFTQSCPTCGRRVEVRATLLGCTVACQHCRAEFVAEPGISMELPRGQAVQSDSSDDLMARVEELLQRTDQPTGSL
jgi:hypothetical protein